MTRIEKLILDNQITIMLALQDISELANSKKQELDSQIQKTYKAKNGI